MEATEEISVREWRLDHRVEQIKRASMWIMNNQRANDYSNTRARSLYQQKYTKA